MICGALATVNRRNCESESRSSIFILDCGCSFGNGLIFLSPTLSSSFFPGRILPPFPGVTGTISNLGFCQGWPPLMISPAIENVPVWSQVRTFQVSSTICWPVSGITSVTSSSSP
jgi:hypothetical protein